MYESSVIIKCGHKRDRDRVIYLGKLRAYHRYPSQASTQAAQALYEIALDVTLAYKRCCVTKIRFIRACMGTQRFGIKIPLFSCFVNKICLPCCCVVLLVFSVTQLKIDQNQNQNRSIDKVQNLGNERR